MPQALFLWPHNQRRWVRAGKVCGSGGSGKRQRGKPKTSYNGNFAKWMDGSLEKIMLDRARWRKVLLHGRLIVIPDGTEKSSVDLKYWLIQIMFIYAKWFV